MLTEEEEKFMIYWEANRLRRKKVFKQLAVGLPLGVILVVAIFVNFFSGWYKRADMMLHSQGSMILVLVVAAILIVIFVTVFSVRHKWEMYEQRYLELQAKRNQP
ncbi:MAG TPA: magnesium transporter [Chitinophagaceae bacterium]|jgi:membrane protein YdbS with pleckstrin-like domain|nr:magnesium transporter [Chitinophagaceae bacterium]